MRPTKWNVRRPFRLCPRCYIYNNITWHAFCLLSFKETQFCLNEYAILHYYMIASVAETSTCHGSDGWSPRRVSHSTVWYSWLILSLNSDSNGESGKRMGEESSSNIGKLLSAMLVLLSLHNSLSHICIVCVGLKFPEAIFSIHKKSFLVFPFDEDHYHSMYIRLFVDV